MNIHYLLSIFNIYTVCIQKLQCFSSLIFPMIFFILPDKRKKSSGSFLLGAQKIRKNGLER